MSQLLKKYKVTGIKQKHIRAVRNAGISPFTILPPNHATMPQAEVEAHFLAQFDAITGILGIGEQFDEVEAEDVPQFRNDLIGLLFGTGTTKGAADEKNSLPSAAPQTVSAATTVMPAEQHQDM